MTPSSTTMPVEDPSARGYEGARGQVLVMFVIWLVVLLGAAALTIDFGSWLVARRNYQNVVDPAVLAGAAFLTRPLGDTALCGMNKRICARRAAWSYINEQLNLGLSSAQINAYGDDDTDAAGQPVTPTAGGPPFTIWVSTPPNQAGAAASMSTVGSEQGVLFARVDRPNPAFMARVLGVIDQNISAWATAGVFPNRWAVITLRRGRGGVEIDPGPANTKDIKLAGSNSELRVINGDVGGNWGLTLTASSGSYLRVGSTSGDPSAVYLIDYTSCGNSCWSSGQITDLAGNDLSGTYPPNGAKRLPAFIPDPSYVAPPGLNSSAPNGPVNNADPTPDIPLGILLDDRGRACPAAGCDVAIDRGQLSATTGRCEATPGDPAPPRLGPGTYNDLTIGNRNCVILDPTMRHTTPWAPLTDVATPVSSVTPNPQYPGIFYFTGNINIGQDALIVGDGVTVFLRPNGRFSPNSGGVMNVNTGFQTGTNGRILGGWTTKGATPYNVSGASWVYDASQETNNQRFGRGIALYVLKPAQAGQSDPNGTDVIQVSSGAGLAWKSVTYAPNDNVQIAGQPRHDGIGQLISWTFTFNGGTVVTQTYDGPDEGLPFLIEPCVLVGGVCQ